MIRKIDSISFNSAKIPTAMKHKKTPCNIKRGLKAASIYALSTIAAYGIVSACTSNKKQTPEQIQPKIEQVDTPADTLAKQKSELAPNGYYIVKKGDNIWNISKALLEESCDKTVTDPDIDKRKELIMQMNNVKYESDSSEFAMIKPNDTLWVDSRAYIANKAKHADLGKYTDQIGNAFIKLLSH